MAAGFSVKDALNKNSKAGIDESPRARFRTKDISNFKMYRNKLNFYESLPSWERGLKYRSGKFCTGRSNVAPLVGARIEMGINSS